MAIRANQYEMGRKKHFLSLLSSGISPSKAQRIVKELSSTDPELRKGIRPAVANRWVKSFTRERRLSQSQLPTRRSDWLKASAAQELGWESAQGFKYHLRYEYRYFDENTQKWETTTRLIGLFRTDRWGNIKDMIESQLMAMKSQQAEMYKMENQNIDFDSIKAVGWFRTKRM